MISDKVALVTGSTAGIGRAIALELAKNEYRIIINGATTKQLPSDYINKLEQIYGIDHKKGYSYIQADISNADHREILINKIKEREGRLDVLVNNAGIPPLERKDILQSSEYSFEKVIKTNLQGPFFLTQRVANWMIELIEIIENYTPYIINISSISSFTSSPDRGEYCISKAGMTMMTKLYAHRLADYGIPVFEIQPGIIRTRMTEPVEEKYNHLLNERITPIKRWGFPEDVANAVIGIIKGYLPYSTGDILHIDGGFHLKRL